MIKGWLHHIDITVSDLARSTEFYDWVLPLMGFRRLADCPEGPFWAGTQVEVGLQQAWTEPQRRHDRYSPGLHHLAFGTPDRAAVDHLYQELKRLNVEILDPPAQYDHYAPGYYAVFFSDPEGIKLEYVFTPEWPV
jgi:catechol 2,3-dioxygenase-like lactoylglutathione lyase family enzyme